MRYSSSIIFASIISFFVFLGMSLLVTAPKFNKSTAIEMVTFSKVRDIKPPQDRPNEPTEPPKLVKIKQPPVAPNLDITDNPPDRTEIDIPIGKSTLKDALITKYAVPNVLNPWIGGSVNRGLISTLLIQPVYPQEALINKIQGWVKIEFIVNEFGQVTNTKVIDAQPKRIFNHAAIKAIQKSKFKPMLVDGKAMPQKAIQVIEFKLD